MTARFARLPLRIRLVAGFAAAMVVVLIAAGAFVYWRVQFALDHRINEDLVSQVQDLRDAAMRDHEDAFAQVGDEARNGQLLDRRGQVVAAGTAARGRAPMLSPEQVRRAARGTLRTTVGDTTNMLTGRGLHLRVLAEPAGARIAVAAIPLAQRDEALRELLYQLVLANLAALLVASVVGYRLTRAALDPVEQYRAQAVQITGGATGLRLDVDPRRDDEIARLGRTLNDMLAEQERAGTRLRQFVDDASHELRTPLSILSADVEVALRKTRPAAELEDALRRVAVDTARLVELAGELLELSAVDGRVVARTPVDVAALLEAAARRGRGQLPEHGGRAVRASGPQDPLPLQGDAALLERALGNLVDNAVRYGAGTVAITAARGDAAAAVLTVHDEGSGMPPDFLPQAAERFRRSDASRSTVGSGIGLSLVDAVATAHGGQLRICSAAHHHHQPTPEADLDAVPCRHALTGTTVTIVLPLA